MLPSVVHFAYQDIVGGSGRSAYRIHSGVQQRGFESHMLVHKKFGNDPNVRTLGGADNRIPYMGFVADRVGRIVSDLTGLQDLIVPSSLALPFHPWVQEASLFQFFNTWGGLVSLPALARLSQHAPLVWRLSDQWLYTGHCVYSYGCERWATGCGHCPQVHGERALPFDTSALLWQIKQRTYSRANMVIVSPSTWLLDEARRSPLIGHFPLHYIPNGVDTELFRPRRAEARAVLGIDPAARVLLFAAQDLGMGRKGGTQLRHALNLLPDLPNAVLLLLGQEQTTPLDIAGWKVFSAGYTEDEAKLALVFAAADVMVLPSGADNLPNTLLESLACGVPIVAFDVGGVHDAVRHLRTGYLVDAQDSEGLAAGIRLLMIDDDLRLKLGEEARVSALTDFALALELDRFAELYRSLIEKRRNKPAA